MPSRGAVFALFYVSGIAGLIYQVLWLRRLSLVFGVTVYAASTVLAAFMAGLAIGSALANRILRGGRSPLVAFGVAEILVGVTGLLSPLLLDAAATLYAALHRAAPDSLGLLTAARLISSFAILAVPTAMMGVTLPLLSAVVTTGPHASGTGISLLYALNTLGAMTGTLLSGMVLIPAIGIQQSFLLAAVLNVAVGLVSLWLGRAPVAHPHVAYPPAANPPAANPPAANPPKGGHHIREQEHMRDEPYMRDEPHMRDEAPLDAPVVSAFRRINTLWALRAVVAVSGFASLGLEIVWFRLMLQFVTATSLAFTAMLATVLGGIAIGGVIATWLLRAPRNHVAVLGFVQTLTGAAAVISMSFLLWTVEQGWKTMGLWPAVLIAILPPAVTRT